MPIKTKCLLCFQYQSNNGEKGVQNVIFKMPPSRKLNSLHIKSTVSEKEGKQI